MSSFELTGSEGTFEYNGSTGLPIGAPYPLPDGNAVVRVDLQEFREFYQWVDRDHGPVATADVLDVAFIDLHGKYHQAEADFRAEYLLQKLIDGGDEWRCFDEFEVAPVEITYELGTPSSGDQLHMECERIDESQVATVHPLRLMWSVYGHFDPRSPAARHEGGGVNALFDFPQRGMAEAMAQEIRGKVAAMLKFDPSLRPWLSDTAAVRPRSRMPSM